MALDADGNLFGLSDVTLRRGRPDDAAALFRLEQAVFHLEQLPVRSFQRYLRLPSADLIVAEHGGDFVGYGLATYRADRRAGWLISLAVSTRASGRGVGMALLQTIEAAARTRGFAALKLETRADNDAAIRLYDRAGYRRIGLKRDYYGDNCDAVVYERDLEPK
jgi:ribosomal-protein-alanine acetyltransferase